MKHRFFSKEAFHISLEPNLLPPSYYFKFEHSEKSLGAKSRVWSEWRINSFSFVIATSDLCTLVLSWWKSTLLNKYGHPLFKSSLNRLSGLTYYLIFPFKSNRCRLYCYHSKKVSHCLTDPPWRSLVQIGSDKPIVSTAAWSLVYCGKSMFYPVKKQRKPKLVRIAFEQLQTILRSSHTNAFLVIC